MQISVESRIHRTLKEINNYFLISDEDKNKFFKQYNFDKSDYLIGYYKNKQDDIIIISNNGLYILNNKIKRFINYIDIEDIILPEDKSNALFLKLHLVGNEILKINILGVEKNKYFDSYVFHRFLRNVISDKKVKT